jgi:HD domain
VLGDVVEADDDYTGEHCRGVVRLALAVAEALELNAEQRRNLEFGALLHDVGKIAIPLEARIISCLPDRCDSVAEQGTATAAPPRADTPDYVGSIRR